MLISIVRNLDCSLYFFFIITKSVPTRAHVWARQRWRSVSTEILPKKPLPRKTKRGRWSASASTGAVDAGKIDVDKIAAELDHQIYLQELAKGNDLNRGNISPRSQITQIFLAVLASFFLLTLLMKWCQDYGESYRTKYAVNQARKRRAKERRLRRRRI